MIDGCHELMNGQDVCDKCMFSEWSEWELEQLRDSQREEECGCLVGCDYCLMLETRSTR